MGDRILEIRNPETVHTAAAVEVSGTDFAQELTDNKALFDHAQILAGMGSFIWDLRNDTLRWSDNMYRIHGLVPHSISPGTLSEVAASLIHPEDQPGVTSEIACMIKDSCVRSMTFRIIRPDDGRMRFMHSDGFFEVDQDNRPVRCIGIHQDITETETARQKVRLSEERFKSLYLQSPIGIELYDREGLLLDLNPACRSIFGISDPEELRGFKLFGDPNLSVSMIKDIKAGKMVRYTVTFDFDLVKANHLYSTSQSGIRKLDCHLAPWLDDSGGVGGYIVQIVDITDRELALESLKKSDERYNLAVAASNLGVWDWDTVSGTVYYSDRWKTQLGYEPEELANEFSTWEKLLHPEDHERMLREVNTYLGAPRQYFTAEFRMRKKDDSWCWIRNQAAPVLDDSGRVLRLLGTHADITEKKLAELEILRLNEELEDRVRERTRLLDSASRELQSFAYSVSHDLRSPLRALDGFSSMLRKEYAACLDDKALHYLERIEEGASRMGQLIEDLLGLCRITRSEFHPAEIDLARLSRMMAAEIEFDHPESRIEFSIPDSIPTIGDPGLLEVVLRNLMCNAYKFSTTQPVSRIRVGVLPQNSQGSVDGSDLVCPGTQPVYFVKDNGVGFDMRYADRLFAPFQRLHGMQEFPGTGIGLVTAQRIIERHGGKIWPRAALNQGATFYFTLG